jgi:hypothetical protein
MRVFILAVLALSCLALEGLYFHARAQEGMPCGKREDIVKMLAAENQTPRALGISGEISVLEIYTSPTGDWTALITNPNGRKTCIVAAGSAWEITPQQIPGTPS